MGTGFTYLTISALYRMTKPPLLLGGLGIWCGYVGSMLRARARYADAAFRRFLRRYQWECLLLGKRRATARAEARQAAAWQAGSPDRSRGARDGGG
jgi:hypothetical protein